MAVHRCHDRRYLYRRVDAQVSGPVCVICGEDRGEHHVDGHCPIYAVFDPDYLAGFHPTYSFVAGDW